MKKGLLYICCLFSVYCLGQQIKVDTSNFKADILNQKLLNVLNSERRKKKVDSVFIDDFLGKLSDDHASYMANFNYVGSDQKIKAKKFVENRLVFYGGKHELILENVLSFDLRNAVIKSKGRLTYFKLSKLIYEKVKSNSTFYANIINPDVAVTNASFKLNDGYLYVCQVFGSNQFLENYNYERGEELNVKNKKQCLSCKKVQKNINNDKGYMGWYSVSNDSIYYHNLKYYYKGKRKKNNIRQVFGRKGVIAIDVIHHEQFGCNGKTAFDRSLYSDGYYVNYIDKSALDRDIHKSPDLYQIYVGQIPEFVDTFYQVDLFYVKKKRPCMNNSIIYVNPDFLEPDEYFQLPKPQIKKSSEIEVNDSVIVKIPFKRGETNQDTLIFLPLLKALDSIKDNNYKITNIYYTGVASIEGNEAANLKLINSRGDLIKAYLKRYYPEVNFDKAFYENFDDFKTGASMMGLKDLVEMDNPSLRKWVNEHKDDPKIAELLNNTRQSIVTINYTDIIPIQNEAYSMSVKHIQDLIDDNKYKESNIFFQVVANKCLEGDSTKIDSLLNLNIPLTSEFKMLNWSDFVFRLNISKEHVDAEKLNNLYDIGAIPTDIEYLEQRLIFNVFYANDKLKTGDFAEIVANAKRKGDVAWLEILDMISGVQNYRYDQSMVAPIIVQSVIKNKFDVYKTYFICQYLIDWGYINEPYLLLSKYARQKKQFPKLYKQFIKLGYFLQYFDDKKEWKKLKVAINNLSSSHPLEFCDLFRWKQMGVRALTKKEVSTIFCEVCRD